MKRHPLFFLTILILVLGVTTSAPAFTFITFDPPDSIFTVPSAINDSGQIVGRFQDSSFRTHGFLRNTDGTFTTIDPPDSIFPSGGSFVEALRINDSGQITGYFLRNDSTGIHGFLAIP